VLSWTGQFLALSHRHQILEGRTPPIVGADPQIHVQREEDSAQQFEAELGSAAVLKRIDPRAARSRDV
jgi:hypothetical protein